MENVIPETQTGPATNEPEELSSWGWFLSGAVLPLGSFAFYRKASQMRVLSAIMFFFAFTLVLSLLTTLNVGFVMFPIESQIQQAYAAGDVPEITISHGYAQVDGVQPWFLLDETTTSGQRTLVAVDTTGTLTRIDTGKYDTGFLLTSTDLHVLSQDGEYQVLPLSDVNAAFSTDPILINAQSLTQAWRLMTTITVILAFLLLVLWQSVVRLMIVALVALILWGVISLIKPNIGFGPVIITGLYAVVPAVYLSHLFNRSDLGLPGLQTLFLLIFWGLGLAASLLGGKFFSQERPMRVWTAWIGVPLLILLVGDLFWRIPEPYGAAALWSVALLTGLALVGVRLYLRFKDTQPSAIPS